MTVDVAAHLPFLRKICIARFGVRAADLDDVVQDIVLTVLRRRLLERYDCRRASIETFLYVVARSVVSNFYARRDPITVDVCEMDVRSPIDSEGAVVATLTLDRLEDVLSQRGATVALRVLQGLRAGDRQQDVCRRWGYAKSHVSTIVGTIRQMAIAMEASMQAQTQERYRAAEDRLLRQMATLFNMSETEAEAQEVIDLMCETLPYEEQWDRVMRFAEEGA